MQVYREACVEGRLRLTPDRGEIVGWKDVSEFARWTRWGDERQDQTTYVRMKQPPRTYVLLTHYKPNKGRLASECIVASQSIRFEDAAAAFLEGTPKVQAAQGCPHCRWWDIDMRDQGYRKTLWVSALSKYVVLETTLYDRPAEKSGAERPQ